MRYKEKIIKNLFAQAGIRICVKGDEPRPYDIKLKNKDFYRKVFSKGSLGFGESYMDGDWEAESLDEMFFRLIKFLDFSSLGKKTQIFIAWHAFKNLHWLKKFNPFNIGKAHYDTGNDLFEKMLGKSMAYSCGYWKEAKTLDEAQFAKYDLICRKLHLRPGMKVLDIGCGWGGFAAYAAEHYQVEVLGVTVSQEQVDFAKANFGHLPITIKLQDYRDVNDKFDRIVSIGMFEHVGKNHYKDFFQVADRCLKTDGIFLLHTIGSNRPVIITDPWIAKYIFPGGYIPAASQIIKPAEKIFVLEDWHNFGLDYDKTLMAWYNNFEESWEQLKEKYGERFYRMWKYYLLSCAGLFRARGKQLWQVVFRKSKAFSKYLPVR